MPQTLIRPIHGLGQPKKGANPAPSKDFVRAFVRYSEP